MLKRLTLFLFPLTILSNINTSLADSEKDFDFGFIFGAVSITCEMALDKTIKTEDARRELKFLVDYAKDSLDQDYFESFTENAYDNQDCIKFLP
tara:strand:+ start:285 stop:566 length:282 start_codon:yes stop_codon:yes gene_type:complete